MRLASNHELTKSASSNLLPRQSKDPKHLNHQFGQQLSHSRSDLGDDFEMVKEMFETFKKFNDCVIIGANFLSGLQDLVVKP